MTGRRQLAILLFITGITAGAVATGWRVLRSELVPVGIGVKAPGFAVNTIDSIPVRKTLADYRGKVLMINIWATWCAPCRVEMPSIEKLHEAYEDKGLKILAISVDDPGSEPQIRSFVKEYGLSFEVLHDPDGQEGKVAKDYQTAGYPETVIVGRDGVIRKKLLGAHDWNSPENRALIERLLAEKAD
jgi:thiol-disulfide isomerase/thioredoxin